MESEDGLPANLPIRPEDCRSLKQWIELGLGLSQGEVARRGNTSQGRISLIVNGQMPRRLHWPLLLRALSLEGKEALFYRWIVEARTHALKKAELRQPMSESHPLLAAGTVETPVRPLGGMTSNPHAPAGSITRAQA